MWAFLALKAVSRPLNSIEIHLNCCCLSDSVPEESCRPVVVTEPDRHSRRLVDPHRNFFLHARQYSRVRRSPISAALSYISAVRSKRSAAPLGHQIHSHHNKYWPRWDAERGIQLAVPGIGRRRRRKGDRAATARVVRREQRLVGVEEEEECRRRHKINDAGRDKDQRKIERVPRVRDRTELVWHSLILASPIIV